MGFVGGAFIAGSDINIRIDVSGDDYSAFLNGSAVAATSLNNNSFTNGQVGLYDNNATQRFDNFQLEADSLAVPQPAPLMLLGLGLMAVSAGHRWAKRRQNAS